MRLLRKKVAVLATLAVWAAAVFAGWPLPKISAAESAVQTVAMINPGFEDAVGQDGQIPGWNVNYTVKDDVYGKVSHSVSSAVYKTGGKSLDLFDNSTTHTVELVSDQYPVIAGGTYTLSAWMNHNRPEGYKSGSVGGSIHLRFYDANHNELPTSSRGVLNYNDLTTQGKFNQLMVPSKTAPADAKYVAAALLITAAWTGNTYFDDVEIKYTTPDSGAVALVNPGFEDAALQDGSIPGWTANYTPKDDAFGKVTHSVSSTFARTGSKSLNLFDNSNTYSVEVVSGKYPVIPGKVYTLSAWINPNVPLGRKDGSVGGTIQLRFYDANNNELTDSRAANNYNDTSAQGKFTQISVKSNEVPASAKYVSVALHITPYWTGDTYFDDIELTFATPSATPPLPPEDLSEKVISSNGMKEVVSIPVPNAGFERGMTSGGAVDGWRNWSAPSAEVKFELATDKKYSGSYSLKLTDTQTTNSVVLESQPLPVKPGIEYTASTMMYVVSPPAPTGGATFLLRFFDDKGVQTGSDILQHSTQPINEWFKVELKGVAPANAKQAKLFALVNNAYTAVAYYDDMMFTYERDLMQLAITTSEYTAPGQTFAVQLGSKYAESLTAADLNLAFDANALEVVDVTVHADFGNSGNTTLAREVNNGLLTVHVSRTDNGVVNGNVGIATVTFKALSGRGNTVLALKSNSELKVLKGGVIESKSFPSDVKARTTIMPFREDVNHDGVVNLVDLLLVAKQIGAALDGVTKYYDLNGDGNIDVADVGLIAQALTAN